MGKSIKGILLLTILSLTVNSYAQVSANVGGSMLIGFGAPKPWGGLHLGLEIPRDENVTFQIQYQYMFKQKMDEPINTFAFANEITTTPYTIPVSYTPTMDYHIISGGTRYYLGNGYDYGFAVYGGATFSLIFNSVRSKNSDYDTDNYHLEEVDESLQRATIISLSAGLAGGVKYTIPNIGSVYLDAGLSYMIFHTDNKGNQVLSHLFNERLYNRLLMNFQIGFRKEITYN